MKISEKQLTKLIIDTKSLCNAIFIDRETQMINTLAEGLSNHIADIYEQQSEELKEIE